MLLLSHRLGVPTLVHLHSHNLRQNSQCQQWQRGEVKKKRSAQVRCSNKTNGTPHPLPKKKTGKAPRISLHQKTALLLVWWDLSSEAHEAAPLPKRRWRKEPPNLKGGTQGRKREKRERERERETMWEDKTIGHFFMSRFPPLQVCHIISLWPVTSGFRCPKVSCPKVSVSHQVGVENSCFGLINSSGGHSLLSVFLIIIKIKLILILKFKI